MSQITTLLFIAFGGAFGACSRYLLSEMCVTFLGRNFPYGTLLVNVLGSFIMGVLIAGIEQEWQHFATHKAMVGVGFLGALTTFSTFSMDTFLLLQQASFIKAGLNILLNVVLSIFVVWLGFKLVAAFS